MGFKTQDGFQFTGSGDGLKYVSGKRISFYISEQGDVGSGDAGVYGGTSGIVSTNIVLDLNATNSSSYSGSGTTWTDLSSSSNNGTLTNGPTFDSGNGGSIVFDGTNDRVQFGSDIFDPNSNFTITAWVNFDDLTSGTHTIVSDYSDAGSFQFRYSVNHNGCLLYTSDAADE